MEAGGPAAIYRRRAPGVWTEAADVWLRLARDAVGRRVCPMVRRGGQRTLEALENGAGTDHGRDGDGGLRAVRGVILGDSRRALRRIVTPAGSRTPLPPRR